METTEASPALRSISIRSFVPQLERRSLSRQSMVQSFAILPSSPSSANDETEPALIADLEPRPLPVWTVLTHSTLKVKIDRKLLLNRIESLIRAKSMTYTVDLALACIECRTLCDLSFALNLWYDETGSIIIELQRRHGCAILMQKVRKTVFHCIQTGEEPTTRTLCRCPSNMTVSARIRQLIQKEEQEKQNIIQETMKVCEEQLCSERHDLNELAMESLVFMTDSNSCSPATILHAAQSLLTDTHGNEHLHDDFVHALCSSVGYCRRDSFKYEYTRDLPSADCRGDRTMAGLSLAVLSNALKVAKAHNADWIEMSSPTWGKVAVTLKSILRDPIVYPHEAAMAALCIRLLKDINPRNSTLFSEDDLLRYLAGVRRIGESHHHLLEEECQNLLQRFSAVQ